MKDRYITLDELKHIYDRTPLSLEADMSSYTLFPDSKGTDRVLLSSVLRQLGIFAPATLEPFIEEGSVDE